MLQTLAYIRVVDIRIEPLLRMEWEPTYGVEECQHEGLSDHPILCVPTAYVEFFCRLYGCDPSTFVTRIQFEYLPQAEADLYALAANRAAAWQDDSRGAPESS